eukprot:gene8481-biopygen12140
MPLAQFVNQSIGPAVAQLPNKSNRDPPEEIGATPTATTKQQHKQTCDASRLGAQTRIIFSEMYGGGRGSPKGVHQSRHSIGSKTTGTTAVPASGPRPVRVRFFKYYRAVRVLSASGPRPLPFLPGSGEAGPFFVDLRPAAPYGVYGDSRCAAGRAARHLGETTADVPSVTRPIPT